MNENGNHRPIRPFRVACMQVGMGMALLAGAAACERDARQEAPQPPPARDTQPQQQPQATPGEPPQLDTRTGQVADRKLQAFIEATQAIRQLERQPQAPPQNREQSEDRQRQLATQVQRVLEEHGLTPQEYSEIQQQLQANPELARRAEELAQSPPQPSQPRDRVPLVPEER